MKTKLLFYSKIFVYTLVAFIVFFWAGSSFGYEWSKTFGGSDYDRGYSVQQTTDGGFIIAGSTESFGDGQTDVYLIYYKPTPTCDGKEPTIVGTEANDKMIGTEGPDVIHGLGGFDIIWGMGSDDVICGGPGTDNISGRAGNDTIFDEGSHDSIWGGSGNDTLEGGDGNDSIFGGSGNDVLRGDYGNDSLYGVSGVNELYGGAGPDNNDTCYDEAGMFNQGCEVFYEQ
jgi:Ca2+-binding RTX toxin-like protein